MNYMNRYFFLLIICLSAMVVVISPLSAQFADGDGTEENPYLVADADQLDNVRNYLDACFRQVDHIDLKDYASGPGWEPIDGFTGVYIGSGYSIQNLVINRPNENDIGLFGFASEAIFASIRLIDVSIIGSSNTGSIIGYSDNSTLSLSHAAGSVQGESNTGGLIGLQVFGETSRSYTSMNALGSMNTGGITGLNNEGLIENCYAFGEVEGEINIGGLVGNYDGGIVRNCYSAGIVKGVANTGGLIGYGYGTVTNSYWNVEESGQISSTGGHGRTTADMVYPYDPDTYEDWDFLYRWGKDSDYTINGYPFIRGVTHRISNDDFGGGNGSIALPWLIVEANHLNNIRNYLHPDFAHSHFLQTSNIDLTDYTGDGGWQPIGDNNLPFRMTYDVTNNHTISNLWIYRPNEPYQGLFGYSFVGSISNVRLIDANITGDNYAGALVGRLMGPGISNCSSTGSVIGNYWIGGLVGSSGNLSVIENCYSTANVVGFSLVGGLTGVNEYNSIIDKSYSTGNVNGKVYVGGLVGDCFSSSIVNSYSSSNVIADIGFFNQYVGGLAGRSVNYSSIENCYSTGDVEGTGAFAGGLVGVMTRTDIENCYSSSNVTSSGDCVGGLIGSISDSSVINSYSTGQVSGNQLVGGLVGVQYYGAVTNNSYWNIESSGQTTSAGGTGLTTREMLQSDTYTGWDFSETWKLIDFNPYMRKHYPALQWQAHNTSHNRIDNFEGNVHRYRDRQWQWRSFPRLEQQNDNTYTEDLLLQLEGIITKVVSQDGGMEWLPPDGWTGDPIGFQSVKGYKLEFAACVYQDDHYLHVKGERTSLDTEITLLPNQENWIGYFIPRTQCVFYAFGLDVMDQLQEIRTDEWGMYKQSDGTWLTRHSTDPIYTFGNVAYGKMYSVVTDGDSLSFTWNLPPDWPEYEDEWTPIPRSVFFSYNEGPDYESFFIEEIADDEDVREVGVYAGDECVGAAVFLGDYPMEILAYTNVSHAGEEISFVIHRDGVRNDPERIHVPLVMDNESGEYSSRILQPGRQRFTVVRLGTGEEEIETIIKPDITLSQNYPNPFVYEESNRSRLTGIPFYVAEEREVTLTVYNIRGQGVKTLFKGTATAGKHSIGWNGLNEQNRPVGSGIYFYRLESGDKVLTRKMLLIR